MEITTIPELEMLGERVIRRLGVSKFCQVEPHRAHEQWHGFRDFSKPVCSETITILGYVYSCDPNNFYHGVACSHPEEDRVTSRFNELYQKIWDRE